MEPRISCPPVFANEPFPHYPPCPSFEVLQAVPPKAIADVIAAIIVITLVLTLLCIVAIGLTLGRD